MSSGGSPRPDEAAARAAARPARARSLCAARPQQVAQQVGEHAGSRSTRGASSTSSRSSSHPYSNGAAATAARADPPSERDGVQLPPPRVVAVVRAHRTSTVSTRHEQRLGGEQVVGVEGEGLVGALRVEVEGEARTRATRARARRR